MPTSRTAGMTTRERAQDLAARYADLYAEKVAQAKRQGREARSAEVAVRAIERAAEYFDNHAVEILADPSDVPPSEVVARLQGILGAVAQALGASLYLAEQLPAECLDLLEQAEPLAVEPEGREVAIGRRRN